MTSSTKHNNTSQSEPWYNVDVVVELLIQELPKGEDYAPEIANLCIGFREMNERKLKEEISDMRSYWPYVFPRATDNEGILNLIKKKYDNYREMAVFR